jgi:hypothetical protein
MSHKQIVVMSIKCSFVKKVVQRSSVAELSIFLYCHSLGVQGRTRLGCGRVVQRRWPLGLLGCTNPNGGRQIKSNCRLLPSRNFRRLFYLIHRRLSTSDGSWKGMKMDDAPTIHPVSHSHSNFNQGLRNNQPTGQPHYHQISSLGFHPNRNFS